VGNREAELRPQKLPGYLSGKSRDVVLMGLVDKSEWSINLPDPEFNFQGCL